MDQTSQGSPASLLRFKVAVIATSWHLDIVSAATGAIQAEFERRDLTPDSI